MPKNTRSTAGVPSSSVTRALRILDALARSGGRGMTLTELARSVQAPVSTTQQLLRPLLQDDFVTQRDSSKSYYLGFAAFGLAERLTRGWTLPNIARRHLELLAETTEEDAYLGILRGDFIVYVDKVEGAQSIRLAISLGLPRKLHSSAVGKLFLANLPVTAVDGYVDVHGLSAETLTTITSRARLDKELRKVRREGISVSEGENVEGVMAIAAPIFGEPGDIVAGICVSGPRRRLSENRLEVTKLVRSTAEEIQNDLRGVSSSSEAVTR